MTGSVRMPVLILRRARLHKSRGGIASRMCGPGSSAAAHREGRRAPCWDYRCKCNRRGGRCAKFTMSGGTLLPGPVERNCWRGMTCNSDVMAGKVQHELREEKKGNEDEKR